MGLCSSTQVNDGDNETGIEIDSIVSGPIRSIDNNRPILFKIVVIGDVGVEKTSFSKRFVHKNWNDLYEITIGVDFFTKPINMDGIKVNLQIWDTAGSEAFRAISSMYYKKSSGVLICFALNKRETFDNLNKWIKEAKQTNNDSVSIIIVGTKFDLAVHNRKVTKEEAEKFAISQGMQYIETSAKINYNIEETFINLTQKMIKKYQEYM